MSCMPKLPGTPCNIGMSLGQSQCQNGYLHIKKKVWKLTKCTVDTLYNIDTWDKRTFGYFRHYFPKVIYTLLPASRHLYTRAKHHLHAVTSRKQRCKRTRSDDIEVSSPSPRWLDRLDLHWVSEKWIKSLVKSNNTSLFGITMAFWHTVRNLHFLSKKSTLISRENCRYFGGEKLVKMLWFWTF